MVGTQQVCDNNDMHAIIKDKARLRLTAESIVHLVFLYFSHLVSK
jgi:hypothetical protein